MAYIASTTRSEIVHVSKLSADQLRARPFTPPVCGNRGMRTGWIIVDDAEVKNYKPCIKCAASVAAGKSSKSGASSARPWKVTTTFANGRTYSDTFKTERAAQSEKRSTERDFKGASAIIEYIGE